MAKRRVISQEIIDQQEEVTEEIKCTLTSTGQRAIIQYRGKKVFMKTFSSDHSTIKKESDFNEQKPEWIKSMFDLKLLVVSE